MCLPFPWCVGGESQIEPIESESRWIRDNYGRNEDLGAHIAPAILCLYGSIVSFIEISSLWVRGREWRTHVGVPILLHPLISLCSKQVTARHFQHVYGSLTGLQDTASPLCL